MSKLMSSNKLVVALVARPAVLMVAGLVLAGFAGCDKPSLLPPSDKALDRTKAEFAADAAKRNYPADAPRGGSDQANAQIDYAMVPGMREIRIKNLTQQSWSDVEVWVNGEWVVFFPVWQAQEMKTVPFNTLYNRGGQPFPTDNKEVKVQKVELNFGGTLYPVPAKLVD